MPLPEAAGQIADPGDAMNLGFGGKDPRFYDGYLERFVLTLVQIWWTSPFNQDEGAIIAHEPEPASQGGVCPR